MKRKVKNTYAKGAFWERATMKYLEKRGFYCIRQPASRFPDILALPAIVSGSGRPWFIECKVSGRISSLERKKLREIAEKYCVDCFISSPIHGVYSNKENNIEFEEILFEEERTL